jgi:hypothetical protein
MDFFELSIIVFRFIFNIYMYIDKFLYPKPDFAFIFRDDKLFVRGYFMGIHHKELMEIPHFNIEGDFTILINDINIKSIKNISSDGFDICRTYFLSNSIVGFDKPVKIRITDDTICKSKIILLNQNELINFVDVIQKFDDINHSDE